MKNIKYTKSEFVIVFLISLLFTLLYLTTSYVMWIEASDAIHAICEWIGILAPIILLISWYMVIERYVSITYNMTENHGNKKYYLQVAVRIILLIICGLKIYNSILAVIVFPINSLRDYYMDGEYRVCYMIKIGFVVVWMAFMIFNFAIRKITDASKMTKIIFAVLLLVMILFGTEVAGEYIGEYHSQAWIRKMNEG